MSFFKLCDLPEYVLQCICQLLTEPILFEGHDHVSDIVSLMVTCRDLYVIIKRLQLRYTLEVKTATTGIEEAVKSVAVLKNNPQWKITKLQLSISDKIASFGRMYKVLDFLDANLWGHLESVYLLLFLNARMESDLDPLFEVTRKLALYNNCVDFHIVHRYIDFAQTFYEKMSRSVSVKSVEKQVMFGYAGSKLLCITDMKHLQNLSDLQIESVPVRAKEFTSFILLNLKNLHLFKQRDLSEEFGAFISHMFPNLCSIAVFPDKLAKRPKDLGLDKLPSRCSTLAINYDMLPTILNSGQFSHLSLDLKSLDELDSWFFEKMALHNLKALTFNFVGIFANLNAYSFPICLDLITRVIRWKPSLQILAISTKFSLDDLQKKNSANFMSWLFDSERQFKLSDMKLISIGPKVIYMKKSLDWRTVQTMRYLESVRWDLGNTNLIKGAQSILTPKIRSQLKRERTADIVLKLC